MGNFEPCSGPLFEFILFLNLLDFKKKYEKKIPSMGKSRFADGTLVAFLSCFLASLTPSLKNFFNSLQKIFNIFFVFLLLFYQTNAQIRLFLVVIFWGFQDFFIRVFIVIVLFLNIFIINKVIYHGVLTIVQVRLDLWYKFILRSWTRV